MNCVNRQQLKGFCLIQDQDNFNIRPSVVTTKHIERKLHSCCMNGVRNLQNIAPTNKNRRGGKEEAKSIIIKALKRWPEAEL